MQSPLNASGAGDLNDREQLLQHILASRHFNKSPRLRDFLNYICERSFANRTDEISEPQIAVHVFGRVPDYNAAEDTIVRTAARQLRQKLELYNLGEGASGPWRLTVPKGSYIPVFERSGLDPEVVAPPASDAPAPRPAIPRWLVNASGVIAVCAALTWGALSWTRSMDPRAIFWRAVLAPDHPTLLVSGDSGLAMTMNITHRNVHVGEYAEMKVRPQPLVNASLPADDPILTFGRRRYTSVSDLNMAVKTAVEAGSLARSLDVRYARDITLDDLKTRNVILVGDPWANPWVELFSKHLNFDFQADAAASSHLVLNRSPEAPEQSSYRVYPDDPDHKNYTLIALTRGLDPQHSVLLVEGTTVAGTDAAVDFLFNSERFPEILKAALHFQAIDDFEVLLETENVAANGTQIKVIGMRVHRQGSSGSPAASR
jgi:hypothetical protein